MGSGLVSCTSREPHRREAAAYPLVAPTPWQAGVLSGKVWTGVRSRVKGGAGDVGAMWFRSRNCRARTTDGPGE